MSTTQTRKPAERRAPERKTTGSKQWSPPSTSALAGRLERLRDEIRLDLHLARMEAKDRWHDLEPQVLHAERLAATVVEISIRALGDIAVEVKRFQDHLRQHRPRA